MNPRGAPFQPGNKIGRGRPKGSRNKSTSAAQRLLQENAEPLVRKCLSMGFRGDMKAITQCFRWMPWRVRTALKVKLPAIKTVDDIGRSIDVVLKAVASGKCPAAEGQILASMLADRRQAMETQDFAARLQELERRLRESQS